MWKEVGMLLFEVSLQHLLRGTERNYKNLRIFIQPETDWKPPKCES
jgi:hypothetical protein